MLSFFIELLMKNLSVSNIFICADRFPVAWCYVYWQGSLLSEGGFSLVTDGSLVGFQMCQVSLSSSTWHCRMKRVIMSIVLGVLAGQKGWVWLSPWWLQFQRRLEWHVKGMNVRIGDRARMDYVYIYNKSLFWVHCEYPIIEWKVPWKRSKQKL